MTYHAIETDGGCVSPGGVVRWRGGVARWMIALLMFAACSPADGDRPPPAAESPAEGATGRADPSQVAGTVDAATRVGEAGEGGVSVEDDSVASLSARRMGFPSRPGLSTRCWAGRNSSISGNSESRKAWMGGGGYWAAKDSHNDLNAEIRAKCN